MNGSMCTNVTDLTKLFDLANWWERKSLSAKSAHTFIRIYSYVPI